MKKNLLLLSLWLLLLNCLGISSGKTQQMYVGAATADISPVLPVALMGQFYLRVAEKADTPLFAEVLAIESKNGNTPSDTAVFVSCDLVYISARLRDELREEVAKRIPNFSTRKIILSAIHTHTAPVLEDDPDESSFLYPIPEGVTSAKDYRKLFTHRVADAIVKAWNNRDRGSVTWGLYRAAIGYNRRAVYKDGTAVMYGNTERRDFQSLEGYEDHDIHSMFFWDSKSRLIAMSIDVACPAQEFEHLHTVNADYWHPVRVALKQKFGVQLNVLTWIGAAGDQSPHIMYRKAADVRMQQLSKRSRMDDIAQRVVEAVERTYQVVKDDRHTDVPFMHRAEKLQLPMRIITKEEADSSRQVRDDCAAQIAADPQKAPQLYAKMTWFGDVLKRYEKQQNRNEFSYETEIHILRIGDAAVCTNQFELFTDYGIQIQARSRATQTFVIQLAGPGTYLPTAKAIRGGGYSAVCQSNVVGAEGGAVLVEKTVEIMNSLWPDKAKQ
ncbi:MAG: hypothetical protein M9933_12955 [Chitinophagaceae bacterium]|nr:hypothetical protein [Chitinophagaceae bacterium]